MPSSADADDVKSERTSASSGTKRKREAGPKFYAVRVGQAPGIYHSWSDCLAQVKGFKGAACKLIARITFKTWFNTQYEGASFSRADATDNGTCLCRQQEVNVQSQNCQATPLNHLITVQSLTSCWPEFLSFPRCTCKHACSRNTSHFVANLRPHSQILLNTHGS